MSLSISIQFLSGRYHATPWDHQVNEGVVEWPPSPWRILRALVSAYYRLPNPPNRADVCQLLSRLAEHPPSYCLPDYTAAHTRHYMPIWKEGRETTTKVFDTFLVLSGGTLSPEATVQAVWAEVQLSQSEQHILQQLCCQVSYLGRAESWAELSVDEADATCCNAFPVSSEEVAESNREKVRVLVPLSAEGLKGFRAAIALLPQPKKSKAKLQVPADVMEALELDIGDLHSQGWNGIPGTDWITYTLPARIQKSRPQRQQSIKPTFARYAIASNVLPNLTEALPVGERLHQALMSRGRRLFDDADPVFSGRDKDGSPSKNDHQHAWYLAEDSNGDGKIDHVVVYAAQGFSDEAVAALQNLRQIWGSKGVMLQTVLISLGQMDSYRIDAGGKNFEDGWRNSSDGESWLVGRGRIWRSMTPMILPRHPKCYRNGTPKYDSQTGLQIDSPEDQVRRLLKQMKFPCASDAVQVREFGNEDSRRLSKYIWQDYQRQRYTGQGSKGSNQGYWFELEFKDPQNGPLALGYAAHFGLGVFVPVG